MRSAHCWREAELVLIVSPQHAWSRVNSLPASALRGAGLIGGEQASGTGRLLKSALGDIANSLTVEMQLGSTEAVKHAVHANLGVSVVMRASVERELASGYLHAVGIQGCSLSKQLFAVHAEHWPHTSAVSRFARQLAGTVAPGPAPL